MLILLTQYWSQLSKYPESPWDPEFQSEPDWWLNSSERFLRVVDCRRKSGQSQTETKRKELAHLTNREFDWRIECEVPIRSGFLNPTEIAAKHTQRLRNN